MDLSLHFRFSVHGGITSIFQVNRGQPSHHVKVAELEPFNFQ